MSLTKTLYLRCLREQERIIVPYLAWRKVPVGPHQLLRVNMGLFICVSIGKIFRMSDMPGGYTHTKEADEESQKLCNQVKSQVEKKTGKSYKEFKAIVYRTQVVDGINFLIKIDVRETKDLKVLIYQQIPFSPEVMKVEEIEKDDPLVPF